MKIAVLVLACALAGGLAPGPVRAQSQERWVVTRSLAEIEAYYARQGPARLVQAQIVLREGGRYAGPLDGRWGPATAAAFASVIETLIAINGHPDPALVRGPQDVPGVTDWVARVILAEGGYGELPD